MKSFEEALKEVKDSLYNQKEVEDYFALKAAIQNNEALQELEKEQVYKCLGHTKESYEQMQESLDI